MYETFQSVYEYLKQKSFFMYIFFSVVDWPMAEGTDAGPVRGIQGPARNWCSVERMEQAVYPGIFLVKLVSPMVFHHVSKDYKFDLGIRKTFRPLYKIPLINEAGF